MQIYFQNQSSEPNIFRALRKFYGRHNDLPETTIAANIEDGMLMIRRRLQQMDHYPSALWKSLNKVMGDKGYSWPKNVAGTTVTLNTDYLL